MPKGARLGRDRQTMRSLLAAATLIPAGASAYVLSAARTPVALRATSPMMTVESWYDQGTRLSGDQGSQPVVELPADNGMRIGVPAGMSESAAAASPREARSSEALCVNPRLCIEHTLYVDPSALGAPARAPGCTAFAVRGACHFSSAHTPTRTANEV